MHPPARILIVDDHQETAECLCTVLKAAGFECRVALNGTSALEVVRVFTPDVILLDIVLPEIDGFELAARFRKMALPSTLVLIALTAFDLFDNKDRCAKSGIDHFLLKPVEPELLIRLIRNALAIQSSS